MEEKIIDIIDMDLSGRGIGKIDGKTVFIPEAVAGDRVSFEIESRKKRYDIGRRTEIIYPSPQRREPDCPEFGKCGGCAFLNISRGLELDVKRRGTEAAFRRAGITGINVNKILSGRDVKYRNKAVFHRDNKGGFGFMSKDDGEQCGVSACILIPDIFIDIIRFADRFFLGYTGNIPKSIMLRCGCGEVMIAAQTEVFGMAHEFLDAALKQFSQIVSAYECMGYPTSAEAEYRLYRGKKHITAEFDGMKFRISPASFFQINAEAAEMLCHEICERLSPSPGDLILDLYCGIGTIGLFMAKHFPHAEIMGVEINRSAAEDAAFNGRASGYSNIKFQCGDAGHIDTAKNPYAVIVDPPRYGLTNSMIKTIFELDPRFIIYMSCNPGTLAGNSVKLLDGGYEIKDVIAADMFPKCAHVESVVLMSRMEK